jgi:hypothetical protein
MSYTDEGFVADATVDPVDGSLIVPPTEPLPEVQVVTLHGGYVLAVLSVEMNPEGHNMAERCKVRTILSQDTTGLGGQIATCLVAEYGLTPEEAETLIPPELVTPEMAERRRVREEALVKVREQREREASGGPVFGWQDQPAEHGRARDAETGRYTTEGPSREA